MLFLGFWVWLVVDNIFSLTAERAEYAEEEKQKEIFTSYLNLLLYKYKLGNLSKLQIKCLH